MLNLDTLQREHIALPHTGGRLGVRRQPPYTHLTLHYNGPSVSGAGNPIAELRQIVADANYHIDKIWGYDDRGKPIHGCRLMYDFVVLSDGAILDCGDPSDLLYHCGNITGNSRSLAVHVPVGGAQDVTDRQWASVVKLYEALAKDNHWAGRNQFVGHCEWPRGTGAMPVVSDVYRVQPGQSQCPGAHVMQRLIDYRIGRLPALFQTFYIRKDIDYANVRQAPDRTYPVAVAADGGPARMYPGDKLISDAIVTGESIGNERRWIHRADGLGFVHWSLVD